MRTKAAARLDSATARARIPRGTRVATPIEGTKGGLTLIYRRGADGAGTWQARRWNGAQSIYQALGHADDEGHPPDGGSVLTYRQACERARRWAEDAARRADAPARASTPGTVGEALDRYLEAYRAGGTKKGGGKAVTATQATIERMIRPELGALHWPELTTERLRLWLQTCASRGRRVRTGKDRKTGLPKEPRYLPAADDPDRVRARRATANRIFNVLRAALNLAFEDGRVASDEAWRRVKPFPKVDEARIRFLTAPESTRLVNACSAELRSLVRAALLTGGRFGELAALRVRDFNASTGQLYIGPSKGGKARYVPLNAEGQAFFAELTRGRDEGSPMLVHDSGQAWRNNQYVRPLAGACQAGKIAPAVTIHELRHTYASLLAQAGCDLLTISKLLGHADTRVTARHYAHLCDKTLALAVTKLPAFGAAAAGNVRELQPRARRKATT